MAQPTPKDETTPVVDLSAPNPDSTEISAPPSIEAPPADEAAAEESAARGDAAIEQLGVDGIQAIVDSDTAVTEIADAIVEPLTVDSAVRALIATLGFEEEDIASITIGHAGTIRIIETDHGGRSKRFTKLARKKIDE